ncbi:MAG TPA: cyclase family protein [Draconibacterium sp.]|nr:cyclase family protein [Draconibacterium sp.]
MKIFDLSHKLNNQTPVFPGTVQPRFEPAATIDKDGYRETHLNFESHLGTHIDAPAHILETGATLDQMPVSAFTGKAIIVEIPKNTTYIEKSFLLLFKEELTEADFILFKTGWYNKWGSNEYFSNFPVLAEEAATWLISFKLKGIGFDAISADQVESSVLPIHHIILENGCIIIENLNFPEKLKANEGEFSCFPLPYESADGSPVRAVFRIL